MAVSDDWWHNKPPWGGEGGKISNAEELTSIQSQMVPAPARKVQGKFHLENAGILINLWKYDFENLIIHICLVWIYSLILLDIDKSTHK